MVKRSRTVYFAKSIDGLVKDGYNTFIEVGPHPVLSGSITEILKMNAVEGTVVSTIKRKEDELKNMHESFAKLWANGFNVNWEKLFTQKGNYVKLPLYQWSNDSYWIETEQGRTKRLGLNEHPLLGIKLDEPNPTWEVELNPSVLTYLPDHKIQNNVVFPAAGYIEMAINAAKKAYGKGVYELQDLEFNKALFIGENSVTKCSISIDSDESKFKIISWAGSQKAKANVNALGYINQVQDISRSKKIAVESIKQTLDNTISVEECYQRLAKMGFSYGPDFQRISELFIGKGETLACINVPDKEQNLLDDYHIHPTILDACFQTLITNEFAISGEDAKTEVFLPIGIKYLRAYRHVNDEKIWVHSVSTERNKERSVGDIFLYDSHGVLIAEIIGFLAQSLDTVLKNAPANLMAYENWLYDINWYADEEYVKYNERVERKKKTGKWLIFGDNTGFIEKILQQFDEKGEKYSIVFSKERPTNGKLKNYRFIKPENKKEYQEILKEQDIKGILHLWSLDIQSTDNLDVDTLKEAQLLGCNSIRLLVQALSETNLSPDIWIVTRGAQLVNQNQQDISIAQSSVWGLSRVIRQQEYINYWGGIVDLDLNDSGHEAKMLFDILQSPNNEDELAIRNNQLFISRTNRVLHLPKPTPFNLKSDVSYLITGAFGALGKLTVDWMVSKGAKNFVFIGRRTMPTKEEWKKIAADDKLYEDICFLQNLDSQGVNVKLIAADIADEDQIKSALTAYENEGLPEIKGIIFAAGVVKDVLLNQMEATDLDRVYQPKVMGTYLLHKIFENRQLDFFISYSSAASVVTSA
ncbi:MAG: KR domain-containing protein, partial [Chloroflexia bacterium]|nr:KR domain-containing protein [Chloroflexia bacterium]